MAALTALVWLGAAGCGDQTAGLVLVFPSDTDKSAAVKATVLVSKPPSANGDQCPSFLGFPPQDPDPTSLEINDDVALMDGKAKNGVKGIPTGRQTVLVKVTDSSTNIFLHGCKTTSIESGDKIEINLVALATANVDMTVVDSGGPVDDLTMPGPDMALHHILSITLSEMRDASRKPSGATVTVVDSTGTGTVSGTTDAMGNVKLDVTGLTAPFQVTASVPSTGVNAGAATIGGISPTFGATGIANIAMPVELDVPAKTAAFSVTNLPMSAPVSMFWLPVAGLPGDQQTVDFPSNATPMPSPIGPLAPGNYRMAATVPATSATTPAGVTGTNTTPLSLGTFTDFHTNNFTLTVTKSGNSADYPNQNYAVLLMLPAAPTQAAIPIVSPAPIAASGAVAPKPVPSAANLGTIQPVASLTAEMVGSGASARGELRKQLTAGATADSFNTAVPDPPTVSPVPTPAPAAMALTITATPPAAFPTNSTASFVHVHIYDAAAPAGLYHWHIVVPATNPSTIVLPGGVIPAGNYKVDVAFVQDFTPLADGTVAATLLDDYSKLIRVLPQELCQRTLGLTVQ